MREPHTPDAPLFWKSFLHSLSSPGFTPMIDFMITQDNDHPQPDQWYVFISSIKLGPVDDYQDAVIFGVHRLRELLAAAREEISDIWEEVEHRQQEVERLRAELQGTQVVVQDTGAQRNTAAADDEGAKQ